MTTTTTTHDNTRAAELLRAALNALTENLPDDAYEQPTALRVLVNVAPFGGVDMYEHELPLPFHALFKTGTVQMDATGCAVFILPVACRERLNAVPASLPAVKLVRQAHQAQKDVGSDRDAHLDTLLAGASSQLRSGLLAMHTPDVDMNALVLVSCREKATGGRETAWTGTKLPLGIQIAVQSEIRSNRVYALSAEYTASAALRDQAKQYVLGVLGETMEHARNLMVRQERPESDKIVAAAWSALRTAMPPNPSAQVALYCRVNLLTGDLHCSEVTLQGTTFHMLFGDGTLHVDGHYLVACLPHTGCRIYDHILLGAATKLCDQLRPLFSPQYLLDAFVLEVTRKLGEYVKLMPEGAVRYVGRAESTGFPDNVLRLTGTRTSFSADYNVTACFVAAPTCERVMIDYIVPAKHADDFARALAVLTRELLQSVAELANPSKQETEA